MVKYGGRIQDDFKYHHRFGRKDFPGNHDSENTEKIIPRRIGTSLFMMKSFRFKSVNPLNYRLPPIDRLL